MSNKPNLRAMPGNGQVRQQKTQITVPTTELDAVLVCAECGGDIFLPVQSVGQTAGHSSEQSDRATLSDEHGKAGVYQVLVRESDLAG